MKFSKTTGCFYPEWAFYETYPDDCIEVAESVLEASLNRPIGSTLDVIDGIVVVVPAPNNEREILERKILNEADTETEKIIESGFVYSGKKVRLNTEDQKNILVLWLTRDIQMYPRTIKIWNDGLSPVLYTFANATELNQFFLSGISHIDNAIMTGIQIKAEASGKTTEELKLWKDPRKE